MLSKLAILLVHMIVALFLGYLSYMVVTRKQIPFLVGIVLGLMSVLVIAAHMYSFFHHAEHYKDDKERRIRDDREERCHEPSVFEVTSSRGFHVDPHDPRFGPIGGAGGLGLL